MNSAGLYSVGARVRKQISGLYLFFLQANLSTIIIIINNAIIIIIIIIIVIEIFCTLFLL